MVIPTPECRQLVPVSESLAILKLVSHSSTPVQATSLPGKGKSGAPSRDIQLNGTTVHQPLPSECYGCVDWFHY